MMNYKHLHYFWTVAKEGGIARASERLHITPQTISGQLSLLEDYLGVSLFNRVGRNLEITETGRMILSYADEIFSLGSELEDTLHHLPEGRPQLFKVGVVDVVPKFVAHQILKTSLELKEQIRLLCKEASIENLLAELSLHHLDLVIADRPIPPNVSTRAYNHKLGESAISFFSTTEIKEKLTPQFPKCLDNAPLLLPSAGSQLRENINQWIDKYHLHPKIVAEFDDSALMKAFGQAGAGIFIAPSVIQSEVEQQFNVVAIGQTTEIKEQFYAISTSRHVVHPVISAVLDGAKNSLFKSEHLN
ncbi:MAG: transcriptional activator NhaR [Gammaproteobacteria bacterium]|nr:transcriptional activator NhaR [Gammaproteobacteria bacterium]